MKAETLRDAGRCDDPNVSAPEFGTRHSHLCAQCHKRYAAACVWLYHSVNLHDFVSCFDEKTMDCRV